MPEVPYGQVEFFEVFRGYHASFPLAPIVWTVFSAGAVLLILRKVPVSNRLGAAVLAGLWIWAGVAYHLVHFAAINPAARLFGALFVMEGVLIAGLGLVNRRLQFAYTPTLPGVTGGALIVYALVLYPLIGRLTGHGYPSGPTIGVPCPTTIFTFGLFLWAIGSLPRPLLVIPILWAVLAAPAALSWGVIEDSMMPVAALLVVIAAVAERIHRSKASHVAHLRRSYS
jgi:hypothetical protein